MGFLSKIIGLAVVAGASYATVKVAQKYDQNKREAVADVEIDEISKTSTADNIKKAAADAYVEASEKVKGSVKNVADTIGINSKEMSSAFSQAGVAGVAVGKAVSNASIKVAEKIAKETPVVLESAKIIAGNTAEQVKEAVVSATERFNKKDVVDAEVYADEDVVDIDDSSNIDSIDDVEEIIEDDIEEIIE